MPQKKKKSQTFNRSAKHHVTVSQGIITHGKMLLPGKELREGCDDGTVKS